MACLRGLPARSSVRMFADATARRFLAEARRLTRLRTILAAAFASSEALHDKQCNQANDECDYDMVELDSIEHDAFSLYELDTFCILSLALPGEPQATPAARSC